ncbi:MAG: universal stress protein [Dermatophilaceae bacterium]|nr:universal stress protein [Intrasporangiaceae bacterium]
MNGTIVVAVSDSPAAFTAAEAAIELARQLGASVRFVTVLHEGRPDTRLKEFNAHAPRRGVDADIVLKHVAALGEAAGVAVTGVQRRGRVAAEILAEARAVNASMIVMARVDRPGHAIPTIGSHTMRVLEFSSIPVLVVPSG